VPYFGSRMMIGSGVDSPIPIVTVVPRSEWINEEVDKQEVQEMYKKEDVHVCWRFGHGCHFRQRN